MKNGYTAIWRQILRWAEGRWHRTWYDGLGRRLLESRCDHHRCQRRAHEIGPWKRNTDDLWLPGSWTHSKLTDWLRRKWAVWVDRSVVSNPWTLWNHPGPIPRTCSFDGGIHPDDATALVRAGWEVESTDKDYKRYLNPPGYRAWRKLARETGFSRYVLAACPHAPFPSVKIYVQHFSTQHIEAFNLALSAQQAGG